MENIQALLDKMTLVSRSSAALSLLDIDLLMDTTRRLYEELISLREGINAQPAPEVPVAATAAPIPEATAGIAIPEPEAGTEQSGESVTLPAEEDPVIAAATAAPVPEVAETEDKISLYMELPAAVTPAETYARKLTHFDVSNRDIRMYIGINDQYNFISELFGNNNEAYEEILDEINTFETKEDALFFLANSGVTTLYGWEEDHFSVRIFYNVLNQFFAAR